MKHILYSLIVLHLFSCSDKHDTEDITHNASISDIEIQELINATDMPKDERASLEEQMINLREDCANGDDDACEELRVLIEGLEAYREEEREEEREENNECAEESRVAYEDCLETGGSEEDCWEEAVVAYEDCLER